MADGDDKEESEQNNSVDSIEPPAELGNLISDMEEPDIEEEYLAIDGQLNQLDACLDNLEARSDDLASKLKAFIQANGKEQGDKDENDSRADKDGDSRSSSLNYDS